ncbi:hypothetical protein LLE49_05660 [Alicyclobacillus tolerans]|uniref:hypothetical protein n=1 Tax=Alicyclobacillus tolerans TaxID=90970 RepID=UPI001F41CC19|nr:hypothetical protein [Alicyclobacillus tolerans]MCF8564227.1 hypothetical protein [Alicyclobacillus tolerans]
MLVEVAFVHAGGQSRSLHPVGENPAYLPVDTRIGVMEHGMCGFNKRLGDGWMAG